MSTNLKLLPFRRRESNPEESLKELLRPAG
jgi:hypothetical protein